MSPATIRSAHARDAARIAAIYNHYVSTTTITFEEQVVTADEMVARIEDIQSSGLPWLVAESASVVVGYAYASKWRTRSAYRYSVESAIYVGHEARSAGAGTELYSELLARLKTSGIHTVIGGIALPNAASVRLHEKMGFVKTAHFKEVGFKFGQWVDVGYWQRNL